LSANVATILDLLIGFAIYIKSPSQVCWSWCLTPQDVALQPHEL